MNAADNYLLIFKDGDHMIFPTRRLGPPRATDERFHRLILSSSTAYWNAYLKQNAPAKAWLSGTAFSTTLADDGTFEKKLKEPTHHKIKLSLRPLH